MLKIILLACTFSVCAFAIETTEVETITTWRDADGHAIQTRKVERREIEMKSYPRDPGEWDMTLVRRYPEGNFSADPAFKDGRVVGPERKYRELLELAVADSSKRGKSVRDLCYVLETDAVADDHPIFTRDTFGHTDLANGKCKMRFSLNPPAAKCAVFLVSWKDESGAHRYSVFYSWHDGRWNELTTLFLPIPAPGIPDDYEDDKSFDSKYKSTFETLERGLKERGH